MSLEFVSGALFAFGLMLIRHWLRDRWRYRRAASKVTGRGLGLCLPSPTSRASTTWILHGARTGAQAMPGDDPRDVPTVTDPTGRDQLARTLLRHVTTLAAAPRNRKADSQHLKAVRDYACDQFRAAGWSVTTQDFTTTAALGVSDAGYPAANFWPLRIRGAVDGVNIIATRGRPITQDTLRAVWAKAATEAGLPAIVHQDNRYTGAGYRLERLVNLVGSNLDRSDQPRSGTPAFPASSSATPPP